MIEISKEEHLEFSKKFLDAVDEFYKEWIVQNNATLPDFEKAFIKAKKNGILPIDSEPYLLIRIDLLSEVIHTSFRKASDHRCANEAWKAIKQIPAAEWDNIIEFIKNSINIYIGSSRRCD